MAVLHLVDLTNLHLGLGFSVDRERHDLIKSGYNRSCFLFKKRIILSIIFPYPFLTVIDKYFFHVCGCRY